MKKISKLLVCLLVLSSFLCSCGSKPEPVEMDKSGRYELKDGEAIIKDVTFNSDYTTDDNARVFYEIFVGSFSDSNGDGIGDIRGIINRLDYLNDGDPTSGKSLGVEGIWLTPIFKSPSYHKYDVTDYYTIDPDFGSRDDLWELIELCHSRNVKVILDFPINHTSNYNAMYSQFVVAHRNQDTDSKYYNYYSFITEGDSRPAGATFNKLTGSNDYYECNFSSDMPELNFDSQEVRKEMLDAALNYVELGVDGFRFDAARYIYYGDTAKNVDFWSWYVGELKKVKPDIYTVAEVWDNDSTVKAFYPAIDCFDFAGAMNTGIIADVAKAGNASSYTNYVQNFVNSIAVKRSGSLYMPFIANHDTDRAAGYLAVSMGYMQTAANLYLLSPGSPFIYYGEELGMKGSRGGANTDANRRLAMLWGDDDTIKNPLGSTYANDKQIDTTVADQKEDGDSLYSYYKRLIMIRKANPEIARGSYTSLDISDSKLGGFVSTWKGSSVCVIHNTTASTFSVDLAKVTNISFSTISAAIGSGSAKLEGSVLTVDAQTSVVLR